MNIQSAFPSDYLKAADLQGRPVRVTMDSVQMQKIGEDDKPVLYFRGKDKGLVLNKTNASMIADAYGDETATWQGQSIELRPEKTTYGGRVVDCIRAYPVADRQPAPPPEVAEEPVGADGDEIPF